MEYYLYTKFNCMLEINGQQTMLKEKQKIEVKQEDFIKIFYFDDKNTFTFFIVKENSNNTNINKYIYPNSIIFEPQPIHFPNLSFIKCKNCKDYTVSLIGNPCRFVVSNKENTYYKDCYENILGANIVESKNILYALCKSNNKEILMVFHKISKQIFQFNGEIAISSENITIIEDKATMAHHGKIEEWKITDENLIQTSQDSLYLSKAPKNVPPFLYHIAFFEAIREKDYYLAKTYLTEKLASSMPMDNFKDFFGEFDIIKPITNPSKTQVALLEKIDASEMQAKVFEIKFENEKINDILLEE